MYLTGDENKTEIQGVQYKLKGHSLPGFKCRTLNLFAILQGNVKHLERRIAFHILADQGLRE